MTRMRLRLPSVPSTLLTRSGSLFGDMPSKCSWVDTLLLSEGRLLVVDGSSTKVWRITVEGKSCYK